MRWPTLACCLLAAVAPAAPVPKGKGEFQRPEWGKPIDPDKECKFTFSKVGVTIEAPPGYRELHPGGEKGNAPRLMRAADGDFSAEVRVTGEVRIPPGGRRYDEASAGLVVTDKDGKVGAFRVVWGTRKPVKGGPALFAGIKMTDKRDLITQRRATDPIVKAVTSNGGLKNGAFVKVERRGAMMKGYVSADGKKWALIPRRAGYEGRDTIKGEVRLGVALFMLSGAASKVTFDRFKFSSLGGTPKPPGRTGVTLPFSPRQSRQE